jgi:uncharacterized protein (DUF433 family)
MGVAWLICAGLCVITVIGGLRGVGNVLAGKRVVRGTRIAAGFIVDLLCRGWTVEQILREYDELTPEDAQARLAYASSVLASL